MHETNKHMICIYIYIIHLVYQPPRSSILGRGPHVTYVRCQGDSRDQFGSNFESQDAQENSQPRPGHDKPSTNG